MAEAAAAAAAALGGGGDASHQAGGIGPGGELHGMARQPMQLQHGGQVRRAAPLSCGCRGRLRC